jgi:MFS family permease
MIKNILHKILVRRHFWRTENFNELNELYVAMLVRGMSLSMMGLFVPIFLLSIGYSLTAILTILCIYFVTRVFSDIGAAFLVARFGPKHIMVVGQVLFSISSLLFLTLENMHWPIVLLGAVWGASQSCFFLSFDVDFSKIKHQLHAGKELGYVEIMGKVGAIIGPVLGGIISLILGPQYIFAISTILMIIGLLPLFKTSEPVKTRQRLDYRGFAKVDISKNLTAIAATHLENTLSIVMWPLFLALFVLPGDSVFIKVGVLSSVSVFMAVLAARYVGRLVDERQGRRVLHMSAMVNAMMHLVKPFVSSYGVAFGVGATNEVVTIGYRLPFFKGYYDQTDEFPGYRIVYISIIESFSSFIKATVYGMLIMISSVVSSRITLTIAFMIAAIASLLIMTEKFKTLNPKDA